MALPENCPKDGAATDLPFHFSGRPSAALDHPTRTGNAFFVVGISFALTPVRCLRPRSRGPWARSGEGGYHACDALAVMEKSLLLPRSRGPWARSGEGGYHACDALAVMEKSLLLVFSFGRRFRHCHTHNFSPPMFLPGSR